MTLRETIRMFAKQADLPVQKAVGKALLVILFVEFEKPITGLKTHCKTSLEV